MDRPVWVIQISDSHIFANKNMEFLGINSFANFKAVVAEIRNIKADLIVLTGDLSHDASKLSYQNIAEALMSLSAPIVWAPGNHDNSITAAKILGAMQKQIVFDKWHIVLLDSYYVEHDSGMLDADELDFLDKALQKHTDKHAMIMLHHHVVPTGSPWLDSMMVENHKALYAILNKYKHIKIVAFGHIHQELDLERNGIAFLGAPATSIQFVPNTQALKLDALMPGYRWFELHDDGIFKAKVVRLKEDPQFVPDLTAKDY